MSTWQHSQIFVENQGKEMVDSVQSKLNLIRRRAVSIVSRAFLGDDDMRSVIEGCIGEVDWCAMVESIYYPPKPKYLTED